MTCSRKGKALLLLFGSVMGVVLAEAALQTAGIALNAARYVREHILSGDNPSEYRILCLGESTTFDGGVYAYPFQLQTILNDQNPRKRFKVINGGVPGTTIARIAEKLESELDTYRPDMVVIMTGINDSRYNMIGDVLISGSREGPWVTRLKTYKLAYLLSRSVRAGIDGIGLWKKKDRVEGRDEGRERKTGMLEEEIVRNPANHAVRPMLFFYYRQEQRPDKIETMLRRLLNRDMPVEDLAKVYADLARFFYAEDRSREIELLYKNAIGKFPGFARFYCELGIYYRQREKYGKAEAVMRNALRVAPGNPAIFDNLGDVYKEQGRFLEAERMYEKARELRPGHTNVAYETLGKEFREAGMHGEMERLYLKVLEIDAADGEAHSQLGKICEKQGRYGEAEMHYRRSVEAEPGNYRRYALAAMFYKNRGREELADAYTKEADAIKTANYYCPEVLANYPRIRDIVTDRHIALICVQYPMWDVKMLKSLLGSRGADAFVDNEEVFREAVSLKGYSAVFIDKFGGDFGHCTKEGNRILAENVAHTIIEEFPSLRGRAR